MEPALIYNGTETLSVTREQAEALQFFGLVAYSPEDGPMGIVYRPMAGYTMADIKRSLA
jgi:hypothetical protein